MCGFDRAPTPADLGIAEAHQGDIADAVTAAAGGMDTIVHVAANPLESADFLTELLQPNVVGIYQVCEAARVHKIRRLVITSTIMVVWGHPLWDRVIGEEDGVAPTCHYALAKLYAEDMAQMYAREHGMSAVSMRLGWFPRTQQHADRLGSNSAYYSVYLSSADAARAYACAVESPTPAAGEFAPLFISSQRVGDNGVDLEPAKKWIGYEPQDQWPQNLDSNLKVEA